MAALLGVVGSGKAAVVAHGDSGVGKSALVVRAVTGAASGDPDITQALCINLRHLPTTTLALESFLGAPLSTLLTELSAPQRLLVIDGAVSGVWEQRRARGRVEIRVQSFVPLRRGDRDDVERAAARIGEVLEEEVGLAFGTVASRPHL